MEPPRVLLVEDHAIITQALALVLRAEGMDVEVAESLDSDWVVEQARRFQPHVVLLDLYLGEVDSVSFIGPLDAVGAKVLMLTASTDRAMLGECLEAGAVGVMQKSQRLELLVQAIADVLAGLPPIALTDREELLVEARRRRTEERRRDEPFAHLTLRERQVLRRLTEGKSAEEIAEEEYISLTTVRTHIRAILQKLDVSSQLAAVALATRSGWKG